MIIEIWPATHSPARRFSPVKHLCLTILLLLASSHAFAFEVTQWRVQTSLYTHHWSTDPDHVNKQKLLGVEIFRPSGWLYGIAAFDNSFGQSSQYAYAGYSWKLFHQDWAYFKLTGGFLHGYKGAYKDKIPLNQSGVAPAIVPAFGLKYKHVFTELQILGSAAITVTAGVSFGHKNQ